MKIIIFSLLIIFNLKAGIFTQYKEVKQINIISSFKKNISDANEVIKRGNYKHFIKYKNGIESTINNVNKIDISLEEKNELKKDLQAYAKIINKMYKKLHQKAPRFNQHYKSSIKELKNFNKKLSSIGYRPLLNTWYKLSKTKAKFIKHPSEKLEKKFYEQWRFMVINLTELYLDEDIEDPMMKYLENYKAYFSEVSMAYKSVSYENIKKIKPLCYKIKAKMEFLSPFQL